MGGGRGGSNTHFPSSGEAFIENLKAAKSTFEFDTTTGKFGAPGRRPTSARQVLNREPMKQSMKLYVLLAKGGISETMPGKSGKRVSFEDGTHISWRPASGSGSPAIQISPGILARDYLTPHKIHFEKEQ